MVEVFLYSPILDTNFFGVSFSFPILLIFFYLPAKQTLQAFFAKIFSLSIAVCKFCGNILHFRNERALSWWPLPMACWGNRRLSFAFQINFSVYPHFQCSCHFVLHINWHSVRNLEWMSLLMLQLTSSIFCLFYLIALFYSIQHQRESLQCATFSLVFLIYHQQFFSN